MEDKNKILYNIWKQLWYIEWESSRLDSLEIIEAITIIEQECLKLAEMIK